MIHLFNISKYYRDAEGKRIDVLRPTTMTIPTDARVGIYGERESGKTTVLDLIAGARPNTGKKDCVQELSPPIGLPRMIHRNLTGLENIKFIARLYGVSIRDSIEFVDFFSELGKDLEKPLHLYNAHMKWQLGISLCFAVPFDCFLADDALFRGPSWFQERCRDHFDSLGNEVGLIFASSNSKLLSEYVDVCLHLHEGRLYPLPSLNDINTIKRDDVTEYESEDNFTETEDNQDILGI